MPYPSQAYIDEVSQAESRSAANLGENVVSVWPKLAEGVVGKVCRNKQYNELRVVGEDGREMWTKVGTWLFAGGLVRGERVLVRKVWGSGDDTDAEYEGGPVDDAFAVEGLRGLQLRISLAHIALHLLRCGKRSKGRFPAIPKTQATGTIYRQVLTAVRPLAFLKYLFLDISRYFRQPHSQPVARQSQPVCLVLQTSGMRLGRGLAQCRS